MNFRSGKDVPMLHPEGVLDGNFIYCNSTGELPARLYSLI